VRPGRRGAWLPVALLFLFLVPLLIMPFVAIFVFAGRGGLGAFLGVLAQPDVQFALRFSVMIALITAAVNLVLGTYTAYVLTKYRFRGREALTILVSLPVAMPRVVVGTSLLLLWGPIGLIGRLLDPLGFQPMFAPAGIVLAHLFVTFPYMVSSVRPVLEQMEGTYEEAAYTMGAGRWRTFLHVILPALRGALFSGSLLTFAHSLGEFGATIMVSGNLRLRTQTAPLYIFAQFEAGNIEAANAVAAVLAVISFVLFFVLLRVTRTRRRDA